MARHIAEMTHVQLLVYIYGLRKLKGLPRTLNWRPRGWSERYRRYPRRLVLERWARLLEAYKEEP